MTDVSVIIPVYNGAQYLAKTLSAIQAQTHPPRYVVVVDDCSTDGSFDIAKAHPAVTNIIRSDGNQGVCYARNLGIKATPSELLAFCDQDDLWRPEKLRLQVDALAQNSAVDFLFTDFWYARDEKVDTLSKFEQAPVAWWQSAIEQSDRTIAILAKSAISHLLKFQPVFPSTVILRRSLIERCGPFDEAIGREQSEDLEFLFRCSLYGTLAALRKPLVTICKHGGNYSDNNTKTTMSQIRILRKMVSSSGPYRAFIPQIVEQLHFRSIAAANGAFAEGDLETCRTIVHEFPAVRQGFKLRLKFAIASLPTPFGQRIQAMIVKRTNERSTYLKS